MPRTGENIYKRKDGRFEGRYIVSRDGGGRARYASVYGKSQEEVRAKLLEARRGLLRQGAGGELAFSDAAAAWLSDKKGKISAASYDRYEYLLSKYILPEFGGKAVADITPALVNLLVAGFADRGKHGEGAVRGTTIENLRGIVGSVLAFARDGAGGCPDLPELVEIEKRPYEPLSPGEIQGLVACAMSRKSPEMLGVLLSLYTGIGTGELCALSWDDVDMGRREIRIRHTLYRLKNKEMDGDRAVPVGSRAGKTVLAVADVQRARVRTVAFPAELLEYAGMFYKPGTYFLTCEKGHVMEQKTFCNRMGRVLSLHGLSGVTLQRVCRSHKEGLASLSYLREPFYRSLPGHPAGRGAGEQWLLKEMGNDLGPLRGLLGLGGDDMGELLGMREGDYLALEAGEEPMDWSCFLSLLFFFRYNRKTEGVVAALGLYPDALRERISIPGQHT